MDAAVVDVEWLVKNSLRLDLLVQERTALDLIYRAALDWNVGSLENSDSG